MKREPLGKDCYIFSNKEYRYGTDAVLLADFASVKPHGVACDLGCGGGIIPLLFCRDGKGEKVYGVDIQEDACKLLQQAVSENGFENNITVVNADIRQLKGAIPFNAFDTVTCNPPYKKNGAGITNESTARTIARHEACCTINDTAVAARKLLKSSGRFCVCHKPERLVDVFEAMRSNAIEPKVLRTVQQTEKDEPWLVLIEGRKDGKPGLKVLPPLVMKSEGGYSAEMMKIYGAFAIERGVE